MNASPDIVPVYLRFLIKRILLRFHDVDTKFCVHSYNFEISFVALLLLYINLLYRLCFV